MLTEGRVKGQMRPHSVPKDLPPPPPPPAPRPSCSMCIIRKLYTPSNPYSCGVKCDGEKCRQRRLYFAKHGDRE